MDVSGMTLEGFFLADYERMRERITELESEVKRLTPDGIRHYHEPTVEDVLREFTRDWCNAACTGDMTNAERDAARANVIAEYAAKLRLADDGGEQ